MVLCMWLYVSLDSVVMFSTERNGGASVGGVGADQTASSQTEFTGSESECHSSTSVPCHGANLLVVKRSALVAWGRLYTSR